MGCSTLQARVTVWPEEISNTTDIATPAVLQSPVLAHTATMVMSFDDIGAESGTTDSPRHKWATDFVSVLNVCW